MWEEITEIDQLKNIEEKSLGRASFFTAPISISFLSQIRFSLPTDISILLLTPYTTPISSTAHTKDESLQS